MRGWLKAVLIVILLGINFFFTLTTGYIATYLFIILIIATVVILKYVKTKSIKILLSLGILLNSVSFGYLSYFEIFKHGHAMGEGNGWRWLGTSIMFTSLGMILLLTALVVFIIYRVKSQETTPKK